MVSAILIAVAVVTIIGILCAVLLSVASKVMAVPVDERIPLVRDCLPGANCGACGFAGCDGYAKALVEEDDLSLTLCIPGGATAASSIAAVLGKEAGEVVKQAAVVHCTGDCNATSNKMEYKGLQGCSAAKLMFGGAGKCTFGCLGLGDCQKACPSDAIHVVNGLARVDVNACTGCGICAKTCPNGIIDVMPVATKVKVMCSNKAKGPAATKVCANSCIGCGMCAKECKKDAIHIVNNVAVIDYEKCVGCKLCTKVCPRDALSPVATKEEKDKYKEIKKKQAELAAQKAAAAKAAAEAAAAAPQA